MYDPSEELTLVLIIILWLQKLGKDCRQGNKQHKICPMGAELFADTSKLIVIFANFRTRLIMIKTHFITHGKQSSFQLRLSDDFYDDSHRLS